MSFSIRHSDSTIFSGWSEVRRLYGSSDRSDPQRLLFSRELASHHDGFVKLHPPLAGQSVLSAHPKRMERSATPSPGLKSFLSNKPAPPHVRQNVATPASRSFAQRKAQLSRPSRTNIVEGNAVLRSIDRPPPGDMSRRKSFIQPGLARRRSTYYESEFAVGRETDPTKDRVRNEAIVLAELRTNVIVSWGSLRCSASAAYVPWQIQDEFSFITDLSYHLSNRYQRSMSSIVINVQHGCCMMFGGSFDPAYTLTIFALPSLVQPTTNKRNAALIQAQIQDCLGVAPSRGYVRFVATPEEDVASGGKTVASEMEELDRTTRDDSEQGPESLKPTKSKRLSVRVSHDRIVERAGLETCFGIMQP